MTCVIWTCAFLLGWVLIWDGLKWWLVAVLPLITLATFPPSQGRFISGSFLEKHGCSHVNAKKRRFLRSTYPLHLAVQEGNPRLVTAILARGAKKEQKNSLGMTAAGMCWDDFYIFLQCLYVFSHVFLVVNPAEMGNLCWEYILPLCASPRLKMWPRNQIKMGLTGRC